MQQTIFFWAISFFGIASTIANESSFRFDVEPDKRIVLTDNGQVLWQYNAEFAKHPRVPEKDVRCMAACYIHPLHGIDGEILTDDAPGDHYHHHGVFWNWPHVVVHRSDGRDEHYDTWTSNTRMKQLFVRILEQKIEGDKAILRLENGWFIGSEVNHFEWDEHGLPISEKPVSEEIVITTHPIRMDDGMRSRAIDLDFTWTIGECPISLRGAGGKSYGGLSIRFRPSDGKPGGRSIITVPDGVAGTDLPETPLPWADYTSVFHRDENDRADGDQSGAAIFVSPDHPDFPPTWLTRYYGPLCLGWPGVEMQTFQPGEKIRLSYRIWIHDRAIDVVDLENAYEDYRRDKLFGKNTPTYRNPGKVAADPSVLRKPTGEAVSFQGKYYLYYTGNTSNHHSFACRSTVDFVDWKDEGIVFDGKGTWARSAYWAPEAYEIDGKYYLFFSAQNSDLPWTKEEHFNIGVAVADSPVGPFKILMDRPIFEPGYPIIDANLFIDDDGMPYLTYSRCCYRHPVESELADLARKKGWFEEIEESWVYGVQLKPDFTGIAGEPVLLLRPPLHLDDRQAEWESRSVTNREVNRRWTEGSTLFKYGDKYYLTYSANSFTGDFYAVGYATSCRPLGPYIKAANNPVLEKNTRHGGVRGTGHNNIFFSPDRSEIYCVYHGRTEGDDRRLFIDRMEIDSKGVLRIFGPSTIPRAVPGWIRKPIRATKTIQDDTKELSAKPELREPPRNDFTGRVGMKLTVRDREMIVSEIGRYFCAGNCETHDLAILDESGKLLASTKISMRQTYVETSGFQYAPLEKPITLLPDRTYYVVSRERRGGDSWFGRNELPVLQGIEDARIVGIYQDGGYWHPNGHNGCSYGPLSLKYRLGGKCTIENRSRTIQKGNRDLPYGYLLNERFWAINTYLDSKTRKLSGWDVDLAGGSFLHRGLNENDGVAFSGKFFDWFRLEDVSESESVAITHRFARQESARTVLEFRMKLDPPDQEGVAAVLLDGENEAFRFNVPESAEEFGVRLDLDLVRKCGDVSFDGKRIGRDIPLKNNAAGIDAVRFLSGKKSTGHVYLGPVEIHKGYFVNERFQTVKTGILPDDWSIVGSGASVESLPSAPNPDVYSLKLDGLNISVQKHFAPFAKAIVTRFAFLLPEKKNGVRFRLQGDKGATWEIVTRNGNLEIDLPGDRSAILAENYRENLWYSVKLKSDPKRKVVDIDLNGKQILTDCKAILSAGAAGCFEASISDRENTVLWIDDVIVHPFVDYPEDYVSRPVKPKGGKTLLGVQSCNLWREGMGYSGWKWITDDPDGERVPFLGFYDEGNPEVTDWQILWQAESGIDFEIHCWYRSDNAVGYPIKRTPFDHEIIDGLFNARYKDLKRFMIMWESNLFGGTNSDDYRKHLVPYWIEYFFKDPSYLKIDNKPVISVYLNTLAKLDDPKADLDYLREECRKAGFDGAIVWHEYRGTDPGFFEKIKELGVDYTYAYTWGGSCSDPRLQKRSNRLQRDIVAKIDDLGMIPSVTNGFDARAWANRRGLVNMMSSNAYRDLLCWLRDDFQPTLPKDELGNRIVLLGNWNEFGEGHYLMPGTYEGFGFLKTIRHVFLGLEDGRWIVPSNAQQRRIDVLYPWDW